MKVLGVIGVLVSVISIAIGLHLHFVYANAVVQVNQEMDAAMSERGLDFLQSPEYHELHQLVEFESTYGMLVFIMGAFSILLCIYPAVRKFKAAWIGVFLGLITFILGTIHGTHLFS